METTLKSFDELEFLAQELFEQEEQSINTPALSKYEEKFYRKLRVLTDKLDRRQVHYGWDDENECLVVSKMRIGTVCPTYMYLSVDMETGKYWFGGDTEDLISSTNSMEVIAVAIEWLNNQAPAAR